MNRKLLMNLQGMTFTEEQARDYYGSRFETAELVWVTVDEDGQVVDQQELDSINAGHGIAISPVSHVPAGFERLQRIYAEGDAVKVTGHMKIIKP